MFTVITKDNKVSKVNPLDIGVVLDDTIIIDELGGIALKKGNPITWPTDAKNGLQAIVDVKAGTLRFGHDEMIGLTEYVVSTYGDSGTVPTPYLIAEPLISVEDSSPVHVLDLIKEWPKSMPPQRELEQVDGHIWEYFHGKWVLSSKLSDREYHEGHWLNYHENKKKHSGVSVQVGTKHDQGKPILGAVPPHAELAVGRVLTFGSNKYARGNWDKVEDHENRYMDAALRHLNAHRRGELTDSESGESHLAHAACCILFMLDKQERS